MIAAIGLLIVVVVVLVLSLGGEEEVGTAPLPQPTASPAPTATPLPTPTAVPPVKEDVSISLPPGAVRLVVSQEDSVTLVSPNGDVTISANAGAVSETTDLVFEPLDTARLPDPPEGVGAAISSFDLSPLPHQATELRRSSSTPKTRRTASMDT